MKEEKYNFWDIIIKGAGSLLTAISILVGINNINDERKQTSDLEFQRDLWKTKLSIYSKSCESAGKIITYYNRPNEYRKQLDAFQTIYWGELYMNAPDSVLLKAANFKDFAELYEPQELSKELFIGLKQKLVYFSRECQNDLRKTKIKLSDE